MWTLGRSMPVTIAVTARIHGHCDRDRLAGALTAVLRRHPMLGVRVTDAGVMNAQVTTETAAEPEPDPVVRQVAGESGPEAQWQTALAHELRRPFGGPDDPLTRFLLIEHHDCFDLAVICHHLVCDGLSLTHVLGDIVARLADPAAPVEEVPAPPMHGLVRALPKPARGERFRQPGSQWPVLPRTSGDECVVLSRTLDAAEGAALQERCRKEGTSVHAALGVAALRALADVDGLTRRQIYSPVNLRPLLPSLPEGACGNYAIELYTWFDTAAGTAGGTAAGTDLWAAARELKCTLGRQTAPHLLLRQVRLLALMDLLPNAALTRLLRVSCKPYSSFTFSNLGRLPFPSSYGEYRIESMHAAINMGTLSSGLLTAMTVDDRICLAMSTTVTDRPASEQTLTAMLGHLRGALR